MDDIFISYAREDEGRIQPLADTFAQQGWSVFWDRRIPAGQTWRSYIGQALIDARCVIVAWSHYSIESRWVVEEADVGQKRGILVPVLLDSVEPPIGYRSIQAADLITWQREGQSSRFEQLLQDISAVLGRSLTPPATERSGQREVGQHVQQPAPAQHQSKVTLRYINYALFAVILLLTAGIIYWGDWKPGLEPSPSTNTEIGSGHGSLYATSVGTELPYFMTRLVTENDLKGKSTWELDIMRNEIFARHGWRFNRSDLQNYFYKQKWYVPKFSQNDFPYLLLTELQQKNAAFILDYQQRPE